MKELVKYVMPIATKRINLHTRAHVPRRTELAVFSENWKFPMTLQPISL